MDVVRDEEKRLAYTSRVVKFRNDKSSGIPSRLAPISTQAVRGNLLLDRGDADRSPSCVTCRNMIAL